MRWLSKSTCRRSNLRAWRSQRLPFSEDDLGRQCKSCPAVAIHLPIPWVWQWSSSRIASKAKQARQCRGRRSPKHHQTALGVTIPIRCDVDMRIVVTGDKDWSCPDLAARILRRLVARYGRDIVIIHGNEPGVDASFAAAAKEMGIRSRLV